jgi:two-component system, sensor histidine kinase
VNIGKPVDAGQRILLLLSTQRDAALTQELLDRNGIPSHVCVGVAMLRDEMERGAGALLLSEECLTRDGAHDGLMRALQQQPRWSDLPVLIMTRSGADSSTLGDAIRTLGNVTLLERPMRVAALITSLRSALRGRERQYQLRDHILQLEQARDAEAQAARHKDEFLAMLAHELRNPLAPVRNALHILMNAPGDDPGRREQLQAMMSRQIDHMVRLVDDLLEVSRLSRGTVQLRRERLDLREMLRNAIELSQPLIDAGGQRLEVDLPDQPLAIDADPVRIAQVFGNLLNNAAKYSGQGDRVALSARLEGGQAVVRVRDSGTGIDAEVLPRVFELFTQGRSSMPQAQDGLGIGLTLVRSLLEMHGGSITAHSGGPGEGAEFVARLPLASAVAHPDTRRATAPAPPPPSEATGTGAGPARVLVVDDNVDAAASLAMVLETIGLPHRVVHDGTAALREAAAFEPQVVLLDIGMPGMDGYEVARQLRGKPATRDALLVAVTGWNQAQDRQRSRAAGFDHHFAKPLDIDALTNLLGSRCRTASTGGRPRPGGTRPAGN